MRWRDGQWSCDCDADDGDDVDRGDDNGDCEFDCGSSDVEIFPVDGCGAVSRLRTSESDDELPQGLVGRSPFDSSLSDSVRCSSSQASSSRLLRPNSSEQISRFEGKRYALSSSSAHSLDLLAQNDGSDIDHVQWCSVM